MTPSQVPVVVLATLRLTGATSCTLGDPVPALLQRSGAEKTEVALDEALAIPTDTPPLLPRTRVDATTLVCCTDSITAPLLSGSSCDAFTAHDGDRSKSLGSSLATVPNRQSDRPPASSRSFLGDESFNGPEPAFAGNSLGCPTTPTTYDLGCVPGRFDVGNLSCPPTFAAANLA
uniref:Putative secreted protein n=1 Tax=Ixodes ricinus TaxID=34613 RepID=A0A6B0UZB0_IXORI